MDDAGRLTRRSWYFEEHGQRIRLYDIERLLWVFAAVDGAPAAKALLVAALRLFVFAARLRADFSLRFRTAFFADDILVLRMSILSGLSYAPFTAIRWGYF